MSPLELEDRTVEIPLEDTQNNETPNYRITFGTFTIRVPLNEE